VEVLRGLPRLELDGQRRREQKVGTENALRHIEHQRVEDQPVERSRLGHEAVHPLRVVSLERVAPVQAEPEVRRERRTDRGDLVTVEHVRNDGVADFFEFAGERIERLRHQWPTITIATALRETD